MAILVGRRVVALAFILSAALAVGACTYNEADGKGGNQGKGKGSNICYERVLNIDKETGQAHYEDRQVPCKK